MMGRPSPVRRGLSVLFPFDLSRVGCLWPACVCLLQGGRRKGILVSNASSSSSPLSPVSFTLSCHLRTLAFPSLALPITYRTPEKHAGIPH